MLLSESTSDSLLLLSSALFYGYAVVCLFFCRCTFGLTVFGTVFGYCD